ncbi:SDR family NAD(P)-dependent oxidoreductase [Actinokineospora pegani]|uniref:SDR family NAD(P)-dependent oxidoreductase n=1 Tax=Actinokineospora pegani TaxID=2654637 RepID=UPI001F3FC142|nr:SDR family NAD(P)-dependent oxidoreductase [Actinokineospora pegani]
MPTAVVLGVGPGLGLSMAKRLAAEGFDLALVSRSADRHAGYVEALGGARASTHACDVRDRAALAATLADIGEVDVLYHGPGGGGTPPGPITEVDSAAVRDAMDHWVHPAVDAVGLVLPGLVARGSGVLLFAGGLSSVGALPRWARWPCRRPRRATTR